MGLQEACDVYVCDPDEHFQHSICSTTGGLGCFCFAEVAYAEYFITTHNAVSFLQSIPS